MSLTSSIESIRPPSTDPGAKDLLLTFSLDVLQMLAAEPCTRLAKARLHSNWPSLELMEARRLNLSEPTGAHLPTPSNHNAPTFLKPSGRNANHKLAKAEKRRSESLELDEHTGIARVGVAATDGLSSAMLRL